MSVHSHGSSTPYAERPGAALGKSAAEGGPLKVLFLVSAYPSPVRQSRGIFHRTLAEALHARDVHVIVAAPVPFVPPGLGMFSARWRQYASIPERYWLNGICVNSPRYLQIPRGDTLTVSHRFIAQSLRSVLGVRPDLIHAHYAYPSGAAGLRLAKAWNIPLMLTLHGSDVHTNPFVNRKTMKAFCETVNRAVHVTAVSCALAEQTERMCGRRPEVIPIGIRLENYEQLPNMREARLALGLPAADTLVLFVGALVEEKGVRELVNALPQQKQNGVRAVVVGDGPLRSLVAAHPSVLWMGSRSNDTIPNFMRACDMIVLPSFAEGMPTVLVEAGAAGIPIIASRSGGIPELLQNDRGLLLETVSADEVRRKIRCVIDDPAGAAERSAKMRSFIQTAYNVRKNAEVYEERYRMCIRNKPGEKPALHE